MSEPLCADCGQLPADMCFTVCGLCWNKAYPEQKQNIATQGDNPISITGDTPTAEALEWVRPYCLVHAILSRDRPCVVCAVTAASLDAFSRRQAEARVAELEAALRYRLKHGTNCGWMNCHECWALERDARQLLTPKETP